MMHVHGVLHLSRRLAGQFRTAAEFRDWLKPYWYHGPVWARVFTEEAQADRAVGYTARDPGTVVWG